MRDAAACRQLRHSRAAHSRISSLSLALSESQESEKRTHKLRSAPTLLTQNNHKNAKNQEEEESRNRQGGMAAIMSVIYTVIAI